MKLHTIQNKNNKNEKGFTIVETLVAIFILLISTTGPLTFAQSGLRSSFLARDQIVAFYLSQDAIETLKHLRDNASLDGQYWLNNFEECEVDGVCNFDSNSNPIDPDYCPDNSCKVFFYDSDKRQFVLNPNSDTTVSKYTRTIFVNEIVPDKEAQIVVEVKWDSNFFGDKRIIAHENIYNWVPVAP